jgi:uncharacterized protein YjbI with pentapeptide repeats
VIGAIGAIAGGIIGGWIQAKKSWEYEQKRAIKDNRDRWIEKALGWAANGRNESLRNADLSGADLCGVDLGPFDWEDPPHYMTDEEAQLKLPRVNLRYANLQDADLSLANLRWAILIGANLAGANLTGVDLEGAVYG